MTILLGAVADDFTGATDLANTLTRSGMPAVVTVGPPDARFEAGAAQAVVVALKSRTAPVAEAVRQSLTSLAALRRLGARQFLFKYCSTFDSTSEGNIGPVADALLDVLAADPPAGLSADLAIVCPAFPENGRTIHQGHLFVGDRLLSESSMKDHPLTPMRDSDLVRLMSAQSRRPVGLIPATVVRQGAEAIRGRVAALRRDGVGYAVADAAADADLSAIGAALRDHALITGGSGVALGLPDNFRAAGLLSADAGPAAPRATGRAVALAGSCSTATRGQIAHVAESWTCRALPVERIVADAAGPEAARDLLAFLAEADPARPVLIYSSAEPAEVTALQRRFGREVVGERIEAVFAEIARGLPALGVGRLVVAGGETSGAVVAALELSALRIGPEIAPGAPWTEAHAADPAQAPLALALKSGNFGDVDFFPRAFAILDRSAAS